MCTCTHSKHCVCQSFVSVITLGWLLIHFYSRNHLKIDIKTVAKSSCWSFECHSLNRNLHYEKEFSISSCKLFQIFYSYFHINGTCTAQHTHRIVYNLMGVFLPFNGIKTRSRAEWESTAWKLKTSNGIPVTCFNFNLIRNGEWEKERVRREKNILW